MFTGIIRFTGEIIGIQSFSHGKRLQIKAEEVFIKQLEEGISSVSIDGACHTVEKIQGNSFIVFSSFETLRRSTIENLKKGSRVNLELPVTPESFLDGHIVQGHIDGIGRISSIQKKGETYLYRFLTENSILKYLVEKDSIAIDGISLTIFDIDSSSFRVALIPQTMKHTTLCSKHEGDTVNIEINVMAKYAEKFFKKNVKV